MIQEAKDFAFKMHGGQTYGDGQPYTVHLEAVALLVQDYGCDHMDWALSAAYLHDVIEDCKVDPLILRVKFGNAITEMVLFCTDELGATRRERKAKTYARMRQDINTARKMRQIDAHGWLRDAIRVKLADRLANIRACFQGARADLWQMYKKEQDAFADALGGADSDFIRPMWDEYERLLSKPPEGLEKALRQREQVTGFAKVYGGSEVSTLTEADAVPKEDVG